MNKTSIALFLTGFVSVFLILQLVGLIIEAISLSIPLTILFILILLCVLYLTFRIISHYNKLESA